ncbi:hypothetical protein [Streptomyces sp. NPDC091209]|jgi:hypothetical protein|uniref:hypothetical protein n=1 Tax=unclassified Streptomyces TaxID=2593676 RepID=UPI0038166A58
MRNTRLAKRLSVITATVALAGIAAMQPASAAQLYLEFDGTQVQVDNDPGDGAASWIWEYGSTWNGATMSHVDIMYSNFSYGALEVQPGEAAAIDLRRDVQAVSVCTVFNGSNWQCTDWQFI